MAATMASAPPMYWAARQGAPRSIVDLLVAKGADVGWVDEDGWTALHRAAQNDHAEVVRALGGTHGAALDAKSSGGSSPLHWAARNGTTSAARALLELGADASLRNKDGKTALEFAEEKGKHETAQLLRIHAVALQFIETYSVTASVAAAMATAQDGGLADDALAPGTRLRVEPHGDGTYARFERSLLGANVHFVRFDGGGGHTEQAVELKGLIPSAWSVLPGMGALLAQLAAAARASPRWVPDAEAAARMVCEAAAFSLLERPHHCRYGGWLACSGCSAGKVRLERWLDAEAPHSVQETRSAQPLRVCNLCLPHAVPGAGAAAAQLEPEPEPAAVAEAVPVLPLARRTLATSNFKAAYGDAEVPGVLEIGGILSDLIRGYCTKEGIPWKEEGLPFLKALQAEAMANAQELVGQIPVAAQRMWTSELTLRGREFCFILNAVVREDAHELADRTAGLTRAINRLCVTAGVTGHAAVHPSGNVCYRGGGFDNQYRDFYAAGRAFRQPAFLATSFSEAVADGFIDRIPAQFPKVKWLIRIDPVRKCDHVNLVKRSNVPGEEEYLFAPYSAFTVLTSHGTRGRTRRRT